MFRNRILSIHTLSSIVPSFTTRLNYFLCRNPGRFLLTSQILESILKFPLQVSIIRPRSVDPNQLHKFSYFVSISRTVYRYFLSITDCLALATYTEHVLENIMATTCTWFNKVHTNASFHDGWLNWKKCIYIQLSFNCYSCIQPRSPSMCVFIIALTSHFRVVLYSDVHMCTLSPAFSVLNQLVGAILNNRLK